MACILLLKGRFTVKLDFSTYCKLGYCIIRFLKIMMIIWLVLSRIKGYGKVGLLWGKITVNNHNYLKAGLLKGGEIIIDQVKLTRIIKCFY